MEDRIHRPNYVAEGCSAVRGDLNIQRVIRDRAELPLGHLALKADQIEKAEVEQPEEMIRQAVNDTQLR